MAKQFFSFNIIITLTLLSIGNLASAEVMRCEGDTGDVIYTNTDCGSDAKPANLLLVDKPRAKNVTYQLPSKPTQARSNWVNVNVASRTGKVDAESVRSARLKMISMDGTSRYQNMRK